MEKFIKIQIQNTVWENVFKYKYSILYFEHTQNTFEIGHPVKLCIMKVLRPVYTKNDNYKGSYISLF